MTRAFTRMKKLTLISGGHGVAAGLLTAVFLEPLGNFYWYYALLVEIGMHAMLYKFYDGYRLWC
jgi:hypothetical protein